ncbi:uncharacterized protein LOC119735105 [Patiria miniata]|uniref:OTU domain-containing protein n=1 Tax=Patiria miniata TaxID=46514 RepID=A0A914AMS2_PATMI|nr:uncharacterized protein LOC119735105 [Patiria miniata]
MECHSCHKTYKGAKTLQNHKCTWCSDCNRIYSSYQRLQHHKCNPHTSSKTPHVSYAAAVKSQGSNPRKLPTTAVDSFSSQSTHPDDQSQLSQQISTHPDDQSQLSQQISTHPDDQSQLSQQITTGTKHVSSPLAKHTINHDSQTQLESVSFQGRSQRSFAFHRIDVGLQMRLCQQLSLPLVSILPECNLAHSAGKPASIAPIIGDGNCFFRTLSYLVTGSERFHGELRSLVVSHMNVIRMPVEKFCFDERTSLPVYLARSNMSQDGSWATDVEIFTAAHLLGTDIYIYSAGNNNTANPRWHKFTGKMLDRNAQVSDRSFYIHHKNGNHYEAVLSVHQSGETSLMEMRTENNTTEFTWLVREFNQQQQFASKKKQVSVKCQSSTQIAKHRFSQTPTTTETLKTTEKQSTNQDRLPSESSQTVQMEKSKMELKREKDRLRKQLRRKDPEFRKKEAVWESNCKKKRRDVSEIRDGEKAKELESVHRRRSNPDYRSKEKEKELESIQRRRSNPDYRSKEKEKELESVHRRRSNPDYRSKEKEKELESIQRRRSNPDYRSKEKEKELESIQRRRSNPDYRTALPRSFQDTETIQLKLMRRLKYKTPYHYETVRPKKIFDAAEWLVKNSPIYQDENIQLDMAWKNQEWNDTTTVNFIAKHDDLDMNVDTQVGNIEASLDDDDDISG